MKPWDWESIDLFFSPTQNRRSFSSDFVCLFVCLFAVWIFFCFFAFVVFQVGCSMNQTICLLHSSKCKEFPIEEEL